MSGRVIKFRAWHRKLEEYVDAWNLYGPVLVNGVFDSPDHDIEQFTGLLDVNGVEIYESDIVTAPYHWDKPHTIIWPDDVYSINEFALEDVLTVIGNIHDTHTTEAGR
jgi:hypothetical protein